MTAWPDDFDTFPDAATFAAHKQSENIPGFGQHSDVLALFGESISAIQHSVGPVFYAGPPTGIASTDNSHIQAAITAAAAAGGGDVVLGAGNYNLTTPWTGLPTGGSYAAGTVRGIRFRGMGRGVTTVTYTPSSATFLATVGNGVDNAGYFTFEDITWVGGNDTLAGIIHLKDPCNYCVVQRNEFLGNGTALVAEAVRIDGEIVASSDHYFACNSYKYWLNAVHFSGFANSNTLIEQWFGNVGVGLLFEAASPDTLGGATNSIFRHEFNGSTGTAVKMRNSAIKNNFYGVVCDGPTNHFDLATGCNNNGIWGGSIDPAKCTFTGTSNFATYKLFPDNRQGISGALSAVTDVNAKAVLQSIVNRLCGSTGLCTDTTT